MSVSEKPVKEIKMRKKGGFARYEAIMGYLCILPWIIGFLVFTAGPIVASAVISFTDWDLIQKPNWIGFANYTKLFFHDPLFWQSLKVTIYFTVLSLPLTLVLSLLIALLMNQKIKGIFLFRTLYYLPAVVPIVATAILWRWIFNRDFGLLNRVVGFFGLPPQSWLADPQWVIPAFVIMGLWGLGGGMLIYLAGLQGIPTHLYEAADIDGAGTWSKFKNVTLPMISPVILYNLIMGIIGSFQAGFTTSFIMTRGGPDNASLFYVLYLYVNAFEHFKMGYACAQAWVLFIIVLLVTLLVIKKSAAWVHYEGGVKGR
ncbi:MAG: sugar ABC transporter permease [Chloroflexi bacterium]|nr:sugar ABC transporter permease [Chloroflexota bacterium]